jgi:hypothetical protein
MYNHQRNANQNYMEILFHPSLIVITKKTNNSAGKDAVQKGIFIHY